MNLEYDEVSAVADFTYSPKIEEKMVKIVLK